MHPTTSQRDRLGMTQPLPAHLVRTSVVLGSMPLRLAYGCTGDEEKLLLSEFKEARREWL
jgi:hypothetical protein